MLIAILPGADFPRYGDNVLTRREIVGGNRTAPRFRGGEARYDARLQTRRALFGCGERRGCYRVPSRLATLYHFPSTRSSAFFPRVATTSWGTIV